MRTIKTYSKRAPFYNAFMGSNLPTRRHYQCICSRLWDGARNTYRVHGLWRVQRCIPGETENPLRYRIENHSCSRLIQSVGLQVGRGSSIERNWPCSYKGHLSPLIPFHHSIVNKLEHTGEGD
jgi:hypothetical protein